MIRQLNLKLHLIAKGLNRIIFVATKNINLRKQHEEVYQQGQVMVIKYKRQKLPIQI